MSQLLALALGLLIGLSLGALGGGGSILTVPALVYAIGQSAQSATTSSLVIVGVTAAVAAVGHARAGHVRRGAGLAFGVAGVPASILGTGFNKHVAPSVLLVCFAVLMVIAAAAMLTKTLVTAHPHELADDQEAARLRSPASVGRGSAAPAQQAFTAGRTPRDGMGGRVITGGKVLAAGIVVGFLTGFLGVGGGFVIVPALVLSLRYDMPTAVGTSLLVISLNSGVALLARSGHQTFHWSIIVPFTLAAVIGSAGGKRIADRVSGTNLTRAFAVLLMAVALYVFVRAGLGS
ncbi:MAG: sulfite exporter TauE/SafE family protein [Actinomycetota bacterium]|nr:sulfite exporter TauE/SafE family protein [Actinomycetota bacterium]